MKDLGLEVETLEDPLHVNPPVGTRVSVDQICQDCELEILGILYTVDLRVIDWLVAHRVVIDCDCRRVTAYTPDDVYVMFQGDKHDGIPQVVYDFRWHGQLMG